MPKQKQITEQDLKRYEDLYYCVDTSEVPCGSRMVKDNLLYGIKKGDDSEANLKRWSQAMNKEQSLLLSDPRFLVKLLKTKLSDGRFARGPHIQSLVYHLRREGYM